MSRVERGGSSEAAFRTIGVTTLWNAEQAEQVLMFLDELRTQIWVLHGEQIHRQRHQDAAQQPLDLDDDSPF